MIPKKSGGTIDKFWLINATNQKSWGIYAETSKRKYNGLKQT